MWYNFYVLMWCAPSLYNRGLVSVTTGFLLSPSAMLLLNVGMFHHYERVASLRVCSIRMDVFYHCGCVVIMDVLCHYGRVLPLWMCLEVTKG